MYTKKKSKLLIIDGHSYLYRSYYAFSNVIDKFNNYSGAIYGFIKMIKQIYIIYKPKKITIIFDSKKKNFRHKLFKKYKQNRKLMPKKLIYQFKLLRKVIKIINIPILIIPKIEADDIIGTIATKKQNKYKILIFSKDKDFLQLINKNIKIITNLNNKPINIKEIKKKYNIYPKMLIDFFSLIGDKSDNIPGIPGIGKKTATILLKKFHSIKNIYQNINKIILLNFKNKKFIIKNLKKNKKKITLIKKLITINTDIPIIFKKYLFNTSNISINQINKILKNFNFKKKIKK